MDIQTNFVAGKMNKSVDERLVPQGEYVNALNVRLGSTETTEVGAVENSMGNTNLTTLMFNNAPLSASARCIGAYEDGMRETIYWFVHDDNNPNSPTGKVDLIVSYQTQTGVLIYHVVSTSVLNFDNKYLITGVNKIDNLLFFTDDLNPPRTINVERNYLQPTGGGIDQLEEEDISVIVKPPGFEDPTATTVPLGAPHVEMRHAIGQENYMEDRFLSFAYRYRYEDGGYSATSLFSDVAFQPKAFRLSVNNYQNVGMENRYNACDITFSTGSKRVVEVDLLYKQAGSNVIYVIKRFNKADLGWGNNTFQTELFTNSKIYTTLGSDELLRLYDNVPRIAKAQTIQGNRLMYGNYVDGYDVSLTDGGSSIDVNYTTIADSEDLTGNAIPTPTGLSGSYTIDPTSGQTIIDGKLIFDLTSANPSAGPILAGTTFNFNISLEQNMTTGSGVEFDPAFTQISPFIIHFTFTCPVDYADATVMCASVEFAQKIGLSVPDIQEILPANLSASGVTLTDKFNATVVDPLTGSNLEFVNSGVNGTCPNPFPTWPVTGASPCTQEGFGFNPIAGGFELQVPAVQYYYDDGAGNISTQYIYYNFIPYACSAGYLTTPDIGSLHSNRDYETGIVYMDDFGRASTVLVSNNNTTFFDPSTSIQKNSIKVNLHSLPPYWASKYKFVVKPSKGDYNTIYSNIFYQQDGGTSPGALLAEPSITWFKLEGDNQNLVKQGDVLTVKMDTNGAVLTDEKAVVLDVRALGSNDIVPGSLSGLYMSIKPEGVSTALPNDAVINYGTKNNKGTTYGQAYEGRIDDYSLNFPGTNTPYDIPAGSSIRIRVHNWRGGGDGNCNSCGLKFDKTFISTADYPNFHAWAVGDDLENLMTTANSTNVDQVTIQFHPTLQTAPPSTVFTNGMFNILCYVREDATGAMFFVNNSSIPECWDIGGEFSSHNSLRIEVTRAGNLMVFETEPSEVDPNLFYDASDLLNIYEDPNTGQKLHQARRVFNPSGNTLSVAPGDVDQTLINSLETTLTFRNCYSFGNGVESFRIQDRIDGRSFNLGERVLAVSNQDYKEADRFAGMTYSGVYSGVSNSNNLNEFNLGLANYKDLETSFGPIQVLHSRETDILVLQEDKISYVLSSKNVITDSTGGGAITSVPEVLGTQVARIEEYGISFNPESFVSWGADMFFTDAKRGVVLNLRGASSKSDQLQVVSDYGMDTWFRDQFNAQLTTQKLGGYDPYMDEYVLSTNNEAVPIPIPTVPCGQTVTQNGNAATITYEVDLGLVIGQIDIPYTVSSGSITINATWNGTTYSSGSVSSNGSFSFNKTANTPDTVEIEIIPSGSSSYGVTVECPPEVPLTVIQVVVNSANYSSQSIHNEYSWTDGTTISPVSSNAASLITSQPSVYMSQTGIRSIGVFPYDGADVSIQTNQIPPDNFVFDPAIHKLKYLSSNTLYTNSTIDIGLLLGNAIDATPITNPSSSIFRATINNLSLPTGNQYLYLIWDFRLITAQELCYSNISVDDVCCDCDTTCEQAYFGPVTQAEATACLTNTNSNGWAIYSFHGTGSIPTIGDIVYLDPNHDCDITSGHPQSGYYVVDTNQPATSNPKNWVQLDSNGVVINAGTC